MSMELILLCVGLPIAFVVGGVCVFIIVGIFLVRSLRKQARKIDEEVSVQFMPQVGPLSRAKRDKHTHGQKLLESRADLLAYSVLREMPSQRTWRLMDDSSQDECRLMSRDYSYPFVQVSIKFGQLGGNEGKIIEGSVWVGPSPTRMILRRRIPLTMDKAYEY